MVQLPFQRKKSQSSVISLSNLSMFEQIKIKDELYSKLPDLLSYNFIQPSQVQLYPYPQLPIIGVGGAGIEIVNLITHTIKNFCPGYKSMGVGLLGDFATNPQDLDYIYKYSTNVSTSAKQVKKAEGLFTKDIEPLKVKITEYFQAFDQQLEDQSVFVVMGSGGTGIGAGLVLVKLLKKLGKSPIPVLILPFEIEPTLVQFTAAYGIYCLNSAPIDRSENCNLLLIDNQHYFEANRALSQETLLLRINASIGKILSELLLGTLQRSYGVSSDLNELLEATKVYRGIGTFFGLKVDKIDKLGSESLYEEFDKSTLISTSLQSATRGFVQMFSEKNFFSSEMYFEIFKHFKNIDVFQKYLLKETEGAEITGILSGLEPPKRVRVLLRDAEDFRVHQIEKEIERSNYSKGNPKIDKLEVNSEIDVKDASELNEELDAEAARLRRGD